MGVRLNRFEDSACTVFIGIGANIGDVRENFARALRCIAESASILDISSLYESDPVGFVDQPKFTNAVVKVKTELSPFELLKSLKAIEKKLGRKKTVAWGPRIIDLDIIFYGDRVIASDSLVVPHPRSHERRFVLEPLLEIEPGAWHPSKNMSVRELCSRLGNLQRISIKEESLKF